MHKMRCDVIVSLNALVCMCVSRFIHIVRKTNMDILPNKLFPLCLVSSTHKKQFLKICTYFWALVPHNMNKTWTHTYTHTHFEPVCNMFSIISLNRKKETHTSTTFLYDNCCPSDSVRPVASCVKADPAPIAASHCQGWCH